MTLGIIELEAGEKLRQRLISAIFEWQRDMTPPTLRPPLHFSPDSLVTVSVGFSFLNEADQEFAKFECRLPGKTDGKGKLDLRLDLGLADRGKDALPDFENA